MIAYLETSAVVKLLLEEEGSDRAGQLKNAASALMTSRLTYAEARAALASAHRVGRITSPALSMAKLALETLFLEIGIVEASERIVREAGDLAEHHSLRGYDAIHLSSANGLGRKTTILVTWDLALERAARETGFATAGASS